MKAVYRFVPLRVVLWTCLAFLAVTPARADRLPASYLLVKLCPVASVRAAQTLSGHGFERWQPLGVPGWFRAFASQGRLARIRTALARDPNVLAVEPDQRVHAALLPDDTHWDLQWGPAKIGAPFAWDVTAGRASVVIAVMDSGMDMDHEDLADQLWVNPGEIGSDGIDNDGNGKVDDVHGWRFLQSGESDDLEDGLGHGTHVAGIVAAGGNNGQGIAGVAWGSRLMILKVLDDQGDGRYSDVAEALAYAVDNGARVANLSIGGDEDNPLLRDAVDYAYQHDVLVVAAAGNGYAAPVLYPAAYERALAIVASDWNDRRAAYSNQGPEVDLTAPGTSIYSTCTSTRYCYKTGTSMATPHVAGLAALLWSQHLTYTVPQVVQVMIGSAYDLGAPGWDEYTGWGRIDARRVFSASVPSHMLYMPLVTRRFYPGLIWPEGE
jgi:subtilisin family serine protease